MQLESVMTRFFRILTEASDNDLADMLGIVRTLAKSRRIQRDEASAKLERDSADEPAG